MKITRVGLDIAKLVFQVHGVDEYGKVRARKQLARAKVLEFFVQLPPCLIGIEACASSHYWGRELTKLGHTVKLIAAQFVQQSVLMVHRARTLVVANRTAQVNQIRGLLGEFGLVVPKGAARLRRELPGILEDAENGLPVLAREVLAGLLDQFHDFDTRVTAYDRQIRALAEASEPARRLMQVEAIGPQTATALVASMGDPHVFSSGRSYAASLGITPRQHSSGGKERLGQITRQGDSYLRTLLVHGARAYLRVVDKKTDAKSAWARRLKERRHVNVAAVALAAKHARVAWAILAHGTEYRPAGPEAVAA
jgi:transposase